MKRKRWTVTVKTKQQGRKVRTDIVQIEELLELQKLIEAGPDWNTIISIVITYNHKE